MPSFLAVSCAMASASPVTILTFTPIVRAVAMVALASSRGGSNSGSTPRNCHLPSPSARATPSERKPRAANSLTALSTAGFTCADIGRQRQDHLRRALRHFELLSVRARDRGLGALMHRVEGLEMSHLVALQGLIVFQAAENGQIDGVVIVRARCQRGTEDHLLGGDLVHAERIAQRQLVLGQRAGLVGAQHVHARQFLDRHQPGHDRLLLGQQARADRHRHRQHRGHRHGNRGHGQHQGKLQAW